MANILTKNMSLTSIKRLLTNDNLDRIIEKMSSIIRIALVICILFTVVFLSLILFEVEETVELMNGYFFLGYSVIWVTLPSILLLIAIALDNRYREKPEPRPIQREVKLLIINIVFILTTVAITLIKIKTY